MDRGSNRAVILMAIGNRYEAQLNYVLPQYTRYAEFCGADLHIVRQAPDPANAHSVATQKILIPGLFTGYSEIAFFDLDIILSDIAPSIFDYFPEDAGFSACTSPRGEIGYTNSFLYYHKLPEKVHETNVDYFADRGFDLEGIDPEDLYSINGGVWLARPAIVSDLFCDTYAKISEMKKNNEKMRQIIFDEEWFAYFSQKNGLFNLLDERFNKQIINYMFTDPESKIANVKSNVRYKLMRIFNKNNAIPISFSHAIAPEFYVKYIEGLMEENFAVHFAGGFEYMGIRPRGSYLA
ncbi:hypothetical protein [Hoeflea poritis]|uniref:Glycosyl transferase n=1 Tax=Hoeflea poritis TaxID=2993659 RepID=A0ABT4VMK1_9HYPH|nr:hypothetical protein [Hoeflea poritis]MDA4845400.1 hypothetical protein [Hoeflea poritis]